MVQQEVCQGSGVVQACLASRLVQTCLGSRVVQACLASGVVKECLGSGVPKPRSLWHKERHSQRSVAETAMHWQAGPHRMAPCSLLLPCTDPVNGVCVMACLSCRLR